MIKICPTQVKINNCISTHSGNNLSFHGLFDRRLDEYVRPKDSNFVRLYGQNDNESCLVRYNGKDSAIIYKKTLNKNATLWDYFKDISCVDKSKISKVPMTVAVGVSKDLYTTIYHLFDKKTQKEIAYISIDDWKKAKQLTREKFYDLVQDYPKIGLIGDRVSLNFVECHYPEKYSGIGKVADQIALEYCLKEGIKPQILSLAVNDSVIAHHKRGRKFFKINDQSFIDLYKTDDLNKVIDDLLKTKGNNEHIDCTNFPMVMMYMPQDVIDQYLEKIKTEPILHQKAST